MHIKFKINGHDQTYFIEPHWLLADFIRNHLKLTGTHLACETSQCGACTVHLNGQSVKSCTLLAAELDGQSLTTIEGIADEDHLHPLQQSFIDHLGLQCGYCTPGMIMAALDILRRHPHPSEELIREALSGNYCRCTGYQKIVEAIMAYAQHNHKD